MAIANRVSSDKAVDERLDKREEIRAELEATRIAFHKLLDEIPEDVWEQPSGNPGWNIRELLYHITLAPALLPEDLMLIRRGWTWLSPPAWLFNTFNKWFTRWGARGQTKASIAAKYDQAHSRVLRLLDGVREDEWGRAGRYPALNANMPGGKMTIEDLFHYLTRHFNEHVVEVLRGVETRHSG